MSRSDSSRFKGRTVLVTGGAGFIGSTVVDMLLEAGASVHVVDNCFAGRRSLAPAAAAFHEVDIRSQELTDLVVEQDPEVVVHLAAIHYIPYCNRNPEETFDVNVMGTRNLLEACRRLERLNSLVFASSAAVYPPREGPNAEDSRLGPMDVYGRTKLVGEDLARLFSVDTGAPTVSARLFNVFGPNETNDHLVPAIVSQLKAGERTIELGNLSPKRDFIHVRDVGRAILTLADEFGGEYEAYNVGTGHERSIREVVECASEALGEDIEIVQKESRVRESDRPNLQADPSRIRDEFGWEPRVEFVDGLRDLLAGET